MKKLLWGVIVTLMALSCTGGEEGDDFEHPTPGSKTTEEETGGMTTGGGTATSDGLGGENPAAEAPEPGAPFDEAVFTSERAAWEAQGMRHYRFVTAFASDAVYWGPSAEITVFPDREPEVVIHSEQSGGGPNWETIDNSMRLLRIWRQSMRRTSSLIQMVKYGITKNTTILNIIIHLQDLVTVGLLEAGALRLK